MRLTKRPIFTAHLISTFHWRLVLLGTAIIVGGNLLLSWLLGGPLAALLNADVVWVAVLLTLVAPALIYVGGGLVIGLWSIMYRVRESVVAGLFGVVVLFALQLLFGKINLFGLLIGSPVYLGGAYLGGWGGGKLRRWRIRRAWKKDSSKAAD